MLVLGRCSIFPLQAGHKTLLSTKVSKNQRKNITTLAQLNADQQTKFTQQAESWVKPGDVTRDLGDRGKGRGQRGAKKTGGK